MRHTKQLTLHRSCRFARVVSDLLRQFPAHPGSKYLGAAQALEDGQVGLALGKLRELLQQFPRSPVLLSVRVISACRALGNSALLRQSSGISLKRACCPGFEARQDWLQPPDAISMNMPICCGFRPTRGIELRPLLLKLIGPSVDVLGCLA